MGRSSQAPSRTLLKTASSPGTRTLPPPASGFSQPASQSKTSLLMVVFWQTTMNTGGVPVPLACHAWYDFS